MKRGLDALKSIQDNLAYDDYLRRLDVRGVLEHYGMENDFEESGPEDAYLGPTTEIRHSCLLDRVESHHLNGDANPSASANVERKKYLCRAFWGGDMFQFIQKMEDKDDFSAILPLVREFLSGATMDRDSFLAQVERFFSSKAAVSSGDGLSGYSERILRPWAWVHPFLAERGIDSDTAKRLQIGWREDLNRITIPVFWRGLLVGWQARAIPDRPGLWPGTWGGQVPKYKSSPGFPKSVVLYSTESGGTLRRGGSVIVVESPFSVIKATALGVPWRVVATFGAKVSNLQCEYLRNFDHVFVWADDDDAGRIMERKIVQSLNNHIRVSVINPDEGMDLGDYNSAELVESKIESAVPALMKLMEWRNGG